MARFWAAAVLLGVAGAAVAGPRMAGFDAIAARSERLDLTGIGWGRSRRFKLGEAAGAFRRDLDRQRFGGEVALVEHGGGTIFELAGPGVRGGLAGDCRLD